MVSTTPLLAQCDAIKMWKPVWYGKVLKYVKNKIIILKHSNIYFFK